MTDLMLGDLQAVVHRYERNRPRSQQREIGPSGVGAPCSRQLAMKLLGAEDVNTDADLWPSTVGTAIHTLLADAFLADNTRLEAEGKPPRWLVEQRVQIRPGLTGNTDLVDLQTWTVVDHKNTSVKTLRSKRAKNHPGVQYEAQAHLYGLGWARAGLPIRRVAIAFYPKSGLMRDSWMWEADYDEDLALAALDRMDGLLAGANDAEHAGDLETYLRALTRDTEHCTWCPFWSRQDEPSADPLKSCAGIAEDPLHEAPKTGRGLFG